LLLVLHWVITLRALDNPASHSQIMSRKPSPSSPTREVIASPSRSPTAPKHEPEPSNRVLKPTKRAAQLSSLPVSISTSNVNVNVSDLVSPYLSSPHDPQPPEPLARLSFPVFYEQRGLRDPVPRARVCVCCSCGGRTGGRRPGFGVSDAVSVRLGVPER